MAASQRDLDTIASINEKIEQAEYFLVFTSEHKESNKMVQDYISSACEQVKQALNQLKTLDPNIDQSIIKMQASAVLEDIRTFIVLENMESKLDESFLENHNASLLELSKLLEPSVQLEEKKMEEKPIEVKPTEIKPIEAKPIEAKPIETKLGGKPGPISREPLKDYKTSGQLSSQEGGSFSHDVHKIQNARGEKYYCKVVDDPLVIAIEATAGQLFQLLMPYQPQTKLAEMKGNTFV